MASRRRSRSMIFVLALCIGLLAFWNVTYLESHSILPVTEPYHYYDQHASLSRNLPPQAKGPDSKEGSRQSLHGSVRKRSNGIKTPRHRLAGLNCDKYGGPSEEIAAEMVYWKDIPQDAEFVSPFANYGPEPKYLTFEPDEGGWNNIRMSMETATVLALIMGRTLVLPPTQRMYLLRNEKAVKNNRFTFKDFFHFDSIAEEHPFFSIISMEEFMKEQAIPGHLKDKVTGQVSFPPDNATKWNGQLKKGRKFWMWLRNVTEAPLWNFDTCVAAFPRMPGEDVVVGLERLRTTVSSSKQQSHCHECKDNPTPVNATPFARLRELLGDRRELCIYDSNLQNKRVIHFMGDNDSGARLLTHFYAFLFLEDWKHDLWAKRFVRDHLRYVDEIQCGAARIVHAMRQKSKEDGNPNGQFDTFHVRRGDFQYKMTRIDANQIYQNVKDVLAENSTIFIATDEKELGFFDPLRDHYSVYFLKDFLHLVPDLNKNYYGMLDQRIASRGRTFIGVFFSTFTGYINRMRGYHSQKDKLPGYEKGEIHSYYYSPVSIKEIDRKYSSVRRPFWAKEFPVAWRDIDHDLPQEAIRNSS